MEKKLGSTMMELWQCDDGALVANRRLAMMMQEKLNNDDDRALAAAMDLGSYEGLLNFHFIFSFFLI